MAVASASWTSLSYNAGLDRLKLNESPKDRDEHNGQQMIMVATPKQIRDEVV